MGMSRILKGNDSTADEENSFHQESCPCAGDGMEDGKKYRVEVLA